MIFLIAKKVITVYILPHILVVIIPYAGEVTEWLKVHAWNACVREYREFESHPLRHPSNFRHVRTQFTCLIIKGQGIDIVICVVIGSCHRFRFDSRVLHNEESRTPPGPGGSNGSESLHVCQGCPAIIFLAHHSLFRVFSFLKYKLKKKGPYVLLKGIF